MEIQFLGQSRMLVPNEAVILMVPTYGRGTRKPGELRSRESSSNRRIVIGPNAYMRSTVRNSEYAYFKGE